MFACAADLIRHAPAFARLRSPFEINLKSIRLLPVAVVAVSFAAGAFSSIEIVNSFEGEIP